MNNQELQQAIDLAYELLEYLDKKISNYYGSKEIDLLRAHRDRVIESITTLIEAQSIRAISIPKDELDILLRSYNDNTLDQK